MTWEIIQNANAEYCVDWDIISRLLLSYWKARIQNENMRTVKISESKWYNPFSWSLPEIEHVEIDWNQVRSTSAIKFVFDFNRLRDIADYSVRDMAYEMLHNICQTTKYKRDFTNRSQVIQRKNSQAIAESVDSYEDKIAVTKAIRDSAAGTLMVGGTFLTGGSAAIVLGGGSVFKGVCKFQDTDSVGAATMEAVGSLAFTLIKIKFPAEALTTGQQVVLVLADATWETATVYVEGKSFQEAVGSGALKLAGPAVEKLFGIPVVKDMLGKVTIPVSLATSIGGSEKGAEFASQTAAAILQKQIEVQGGKKVEGWLGEKEKGGGSSKGSKHGSLVKHAMIDSEMLLKLAVVNMKNGIGRGW